MTKDKPLSADDVLKFIYDERYTLNGKSDSLILIEAYATQQCAEYIADVKRLREAGIDLLDDVRIQDGYPCHAPDQLKAEALASALAATDKQEYK